jgi:hypothetical protein
LILIGLGNQLSTASPLQCLHGARCRIAIHVYFPRPPAAVGKLALARLASTLSPPEEGLPFLRRCLARHIYAAKLVDDIGVCSIRSEALDRQKNPSRLGGLAREIMTDGDLRHRKSATGPDKDLLGFDDFSTE